MEGFLCYRIGGLIFGAASTWRGLLSEFYGKLNIPGGILWISINRHDPMGAKIKTQKNP